MSHAFLVADHDAPFTTDERTNEHQIDPAEELEAAIIARTNGTIRNLRVTCRGRMAFLSGDTNSYYKKQLATEAVLGWEWRPMNDIEVHGS